MPDHSVAPPAAETLATDAIQQAIDACHAGGGGRVVLQAGSYTSGTIVLKSFVELHLEAGAHLQASADPADYQNKDVAGEYGGNKGGFLIQADDAEHLAITGLGVIDGRCLAFMDGWWVEDGPYIYKPKEFRPRGIGLFGCRNVVLRDVTIRDAAQWTVHLTGCEEVLVHGVTIKNRLDVPNCDGIDPDHCRNVRIIACHIEAGDDGIVLKNTKNFRQYGACENILISDCSIVSTSAGIKIGTESQGDFRNVLVNNCTVQRSHRGLAIQLRDDGCIENIVFSNCLVQTRLFHTKWWGRAEPIYVTALPRHDGDRPGTVRNVRFSNILCESENGVFLSATPEAPLEDILLDNVQVRIEQRSKWPGGMHDRRPMHSQEHGGLDEHPTSAIYADHVNGLTLRRTQVAWQGETQDWWAHALETVQVAGLVLDDFQGRAGRDGVEDQVAR